MTARRMEILPWIGMGFSLLLVIVYFASALLIRDSSIQVDEKDVFQFQDCPDASCAPEAYLLISLRSYNPSSQKLEMLLRLYPNSSLGYAWANGGVFNESVMLSYGADGEGNWRIPSYEVTGGRATTITVGSLVPSSWYPFDSGTAKVGYRLTSLISGATIPLSIKISPDPVSGFTTYTDVAESNSTNPNLTDYEEFGLKISRSPSQLLMTSLLVLVIVIGALSAIVTTVAISNGKRPPSQLILAWLATYLFALIQIRAEFPGNPAIGNVLDRVITFPVITMLIVLIVWNAAIWMKREDWDAKNQYSYEL